MKRLLLLFAFFFTVFPDELLRFAASILAFITERAAFVLTVHFVCLTALQRLKTAYEI